MNMNAHEFVSHKRSAFDALEGSEPKVLSEVTGCRWPVGHDHPQLFCNRTFYHRPASEGVPPKVCSFCEHHYRLAYVKGAYIKMPRKQP